jgi:uncharacterized repeat protein (TIGR03803 family)
MSSELRLELAKECIMRSTVQPGWMGIGRWVANIGMAFAILLLLAVVATRPVQAKSFSVLYAFKGGTDAANPMASLIQDAAGNFYGTTYDGGDSNLGAVFMLDAAGNETVLYSFTSGTDGQYPRAALVRDAAGNLFGTTSYGGTSNRGTVFKLDATGKETVLYNFTGGADGGNPFASLLLGGGGNLYGTTSGGGPSGFGTVFKLDATGKETVLYGFTGGADGGSPLAGLILSPAGKFYGTTYAGGAFGFGTVFQLDATGKQTVLHSFADGSDGSGPKAGLVRDSVGNLYGTTYSGGAAGYGTVFKLAPSGKETVLYSFTGGADGINPEAGLVRDTFGNLFGTTYGGGAPGYGTVFKVDTTGREIVLYRFAPGAGMVPRAGLIRDAGGNFYGTTSSGGSGGGTVFKLSP